MITDKVGYKRERNYVLDKFGVYIQHPCFIANVKSALGISSGPSPNRINPTTLTNPCPSNLWSMVEESVRFVHADKFPISN